jgi:predicted glycosyltransferase
MRILGRLLFPSLLSIMFIVSCSLTSTGISGDNGQSQPQGSPQKMAQLIIKFRKADFDPSQNDFVQKLSDKAQTPIIYLRPMSGGAHVFRVMNIADDTQLKTIIQKLSKMPEILYVEQDRIMQHYQVQ